MPKCKNSDTWTYKGTEPSPKGLGYCAKGEKINKKMKGNDGNMWIINETKTGVKRWIKFTKQSKTPKKSLNKSTCHFCYTFVHVLILPICIKFDIELPPAIP